MQEITTVGLDLAKQVFHLVGCNQHGKEVSKKMLRRQHVLTYFASLPACLIGLEACAGAHDWARKLQALGHEVRLIAAQHVKAYLRGNKNDFNDARAIAEAVVRPGMRFVAIKTVEQQDLQALHRLRQARIAERTALCNQLRGLLAEYGIVLTQGVACLRKTLPTLLEETENALSNRLRSWLARAYQQLCEVDEHIEYYNAQLKRHAHTQPAVKRLQTAPGFGPVVASVFYGMVGNGQAYRRGRDVAAALGLVPKQHSSGGKSVLLGISKRGDGYLRSLLVHAARAVIRQSARKTDRLNNWINRLKVKRGMHKTIVALANKLARIGWALLRHDTVYQTA
ncbi:MAG: IS110 family transposase [Candidatus Competibacteraceae bacterium]|nr:IS110 family transposase [Candidatus Competibacteraceae bacterium]